MTTALCLPAFAQGTAFTYQGRLNDSGTPYSGSAEFQPALWNAVSGGTLEAANNPVTVIVSVTNGLFVLPLDFGANFPGANRWLQLDVRTVIGPFTPLSPRQPLTPTPYAITASNLSGTLPVAQLTGTIPAGQLPASLVTNNAGGLSLAGDFTGNGAGVTNVNAASLNGVNSSNFWQLGGNNVSAAQFLGSINNQAVEIKVNGARVLRLEPTADGSPNVIGGLPQNYNSPNVYGSTIGGGGATFAFGSNSVAGRYATISGGWANTIDYAADSATISGGGRNTILQSYVGGNNSYTTIGGGEGNLIQSGSYDSTIAGGAGNTISYGGIYSAIGGGLQNTNLGDYATIPGGYANVAAATSFAAGYRAKAITGGTFVWSDSSGGDFTSTAPNQFLIRASGGVGVGETRPSAALHLTAPAGIPPAALPLANCGLLFGTVGTTGYKWIQSYNGPLILNQRGNNVGIGKTNPASALDVAGTVTAVAFNPPSDRNLKENFAPVSPGEVLEKVAALPISRWNFKGDEGTLHVGPMAQDFYAAFGTGTDERHIATVDADGVALAAIQGLNEKVESGKRKAETRIKKLETENTELKNELAEIKRLLLNQNAKRN